MQADILNIITTYNSKTNQCLVKEFQDKILYYESLTDKYKVIIAQWRIPNRSESFKGIYNFKKKLDSGELIFQVVGSLPGNYKIGNYK